MSNVLKVSHREAIQSLYQKGWSQRRIARELGLHRRTVGRYIGGNGSKCTSISTAGCQEAQGAKCTISTAGKTGRKSLCAEFETAILEKLEAGLSAQRIYQDLAENGFEDSYESVKRFVRRMKEKQPVRVWRRECRPGEEMQVDFGLGAPIHDGQSGRECRSWVFRVVLSYSRKGYSEAVKRLDTETFLRCLENAVRYFGGVPQLLSLDNLKAAVLKADWHDPDLNPKLAEFCRHYGMNVVPCRPRKPEHKGKVERGIGYVKNNALKGRRFGSLAEQNLHLQKWESTVADTRIHGTTCRQVAALFAEEKPHLLPLPTGIFPCYQEARRSVNRDSFVEVARAYYEAPPEYIGRQVWVRWDSRSVRIFNGRMEQVQLHTRIEPGRFSRILGALGLSAPVFISCRQWVRRAAGLGENCRQWAQGAFDARGAEALRSIMGLCSLAGKHPASAIDEACGKALRAGASRLKDVRHLIGRDREQSDFAFLEIHPLIRDLKTYSEFINDNPCNTYDQHTKTILPDASALGTA